MKSSRLISSSLLLVSLLAFAGCAGTPAAKDSTAKSDEYEYVTPLGSNIPVRVKKGEKAATTSPTATMTGEQAANAIHSAGGQITPPRGVSGL